VVIHKPVHRPVNGPVRDVMDATPLPWEGTSPAPSGGAALTPPDALLNAEAFYWADDGPVLDVNDGIQAWANLGSAGSALDTTQGTAGARLIHLASDPDFDGRASAEGDTNRWIPGVVSTLFDLADGDSIDCLWFGLVDVVNTIHALYGNRDGAADGLRQAVHNANSRIRSDVTSDTGVNSLGLSPSEGITAGVPFATRLSLIGAASPTNDTTQSYQDGTSGADGSSNCGAVTTGVSFALGSTAGESLSQGLDGRFTLFAAKLGGWSGAELTEISDFLAEAYPSWVGSAV
jgi:hypothetical protein